MVCARARIFWLFVLMLFFFPSEIASAEERSGSPREDSLTVDFKEDLLKLSVRNQKFHEVLDEVAQKSEIRIVVTNPVDEDVTIHFDYQPLEKGVHQLLKGRNFVFIYRSEEAHRSSRLAQVLVLPGSQRSAVTRTEEVSGKPSAEQASQTSAVKGMEHLDQKGGVEEVLQGFSQKASTLQRAFQDALKGLQETEDPGKDMLFDEETLQGFPQEDLDLIRPLTDTPEGKR